MKGKIKLLDVNLLIALAWPSHIHHDAAHRWFSTCAKAGWATCPITQCGFVRISSNQKIIPEAVSPNEAISTLQAIVAMKGHVFWADEIELSEDHGVPTELLVGHRQVTDAYLLGLAISKKGCLATLDKGVESLLPGKSRYASCLEIVAA